MRLPSLLPADRPTRDGDSAPEATTMPTIAGFEFLIRHCGSSQTAVFAQAVDADGKPLPAILLADIWITSCANGIGVHPAFGGGSRDKARRVDAEVPRPCHGTTFFAPTGAPIWRLQSRDDGRVGITFSAREFPIYVAVQAAGMAFPSVSRALNPSDFGPIPVHEQKMTFTKRAATRR